MKFVSTNTIYFFETEDGIQYRTIGSGYYWEKLCGYSWKPVYNYQEETYCIQEFLKYKGSQNEQS